MGHRLFHSMKGSDYDRTPEINRRLQEQNPREWWKYRGVVGAPTENTDWEATSVC